MNVPKPRTFKELITLSPLERGQLVAQADPETIRAIEEKIKAVEDEMRRTVVRGFMGEKI